MYKMERIDTVSVLPRKFFSDVTSCCLIVLVSHYQLFCFVVVCRHSRGTRSSNRNTQANFALGMSMSFLLISSSKRLRLPTRAILILSIATVSNEIQGRRENTVETVANSVSSSSWISFETVAIERRIKIARARF